MSLIQSSQVFTCTDGKQFSDMASAEAHQVMLENAAGVEKVASSLRRLQPCYLLLNLHSPGYWEYTHHECILNDSVVGGKNSPSRYLQGARLRHT